MRRRLQTSKRMVTRDGLSRSTSKRLPLDSPPGALGDVGFTPAEGGQATVEGYGASKTLRVGSVSILLWEGRVPGPPRWVENCGRTPPEASQIVGENVEREPAHRPARTTSSEGFRAAGYCGLGLEGEVRRAARGLGGIRSDTSRRQRRLSTKAPRRGREGPTFRRRLFPTREGGCLVAESDDTTATACGAGRTTYRVTLLQIVEHLQRLRICRVCRDKTRSPRIFFVA